MTNRDLSQIADGEPARKKNGAKAARPAAAPKATLKHLQAGTVTAMPDQLNPQLATLAKSIPTGEEWLHEIKLDGYRILARIDHGQVILQTRSGLDWTDRFPTIADRLSKLNVEQAGWMARSSLKMNVVSQFPKAAKCLGRETRWVARVLRIRLAWAEGHDLSKLPLVERKQILRSLLLPESKRAAASQSLVRFHDHIAGAGKNVLDSACDLKLEGIVSKRLDSTYQSRRTDSWIKTKCQHEQEFVIAGYTRPAGSEPASVRCCSVTIAMRIWFIAGE